MKIKICSLIFLFFTTSFFGQTRSSIDSLKNSLQNTSSDTTKITKYISLSAAYHAIDIDSMNYYAKKALKLSLTNNNYKIARVYGNLGVYQNEISKVDSARFYFDKALKVLDAKDDKILRAVLYGNYSLTYEKTNNLEKELEYSLKAIELVKNNDTELSWLYFNHASIYDDAGFKNESKKYLRLAYLSSKKANEYRVETYALAELSDYCILEKKYDSAMVYLRQGLELCKITKSSETNFAINAGLGKLYDELKMYNKADKALHKALKHAKLLKRNYYIMMCNQLLGEHELRKGNYKKAAYYFSEFDNLYLKEEAPQIGILAYKSWANAETKMKNYKKSNRILKKYFTIKDSIYLRKNKKLLANADAKFRTEKKDKEIIQQQLQLEYQKNELQKKKTQFNYMTSIAIFLLLVSILTWLIFKQRQKRKNQEIIMLKREHQIKTLESLIAGEEKERFRIAKELHDGVNGDLSAVKYKLSTLLEMNNTVIKEAITMIDNSCNQVRAISHNLVPPSLENFNLLEAVEEYCEKLNSLHTQKITFQHLGDAVTLSKNEEINIFRIIQELVTNSIKHANATDINVQISCRYKNLQITIEDNGKGFDRVKVEKKGIGLKNIQSRVDYLNATLDLISNQQGTSYTIEIDKSRNGNN